MKNKLKIILAVGFAVLLSGCVGTPDAEGWRYGQKSEFLQILERDKYASICNQQTLYAHAKESRNSKLMTKMLVAYTTNLANGCINLPAFNAAQDARKSKKFSSTYVPYLQEVNVNTIKMQIKAGQTIEQILKPYVPEYHQFFDLVNAYNRLGNDSNISSANLHIIRLNIERIKLMKSGLGEHYALVNIPEFKVRLIEKEKTAVSMKIVVGKKHMQTPVFSEDLQYITLNPQWSVPDSIARNEVIPDLLKDPSYLKRKRMVMRKTYDLKSKKLTPSMVDLRAYVGGKGEVPFKFIEVPSKWNGLGRVKFIFPNRHSVYMHDTQSKHLFKRTVRTYSHGCVRLEKPVLMLNYLATNYTSKKPEEVKKMYDSLKTSHLALTKRLPVHTVYMTAYVAQDGRLHFYNDIYDFDKLQKLTF